MVRPERDVLVSPEVDRIDIGHEERAPLDGQPGNVLRVDAIEARADRRVDDEQVLRGKVGGSKKHDGDPGVERLTNVECAVRNYEAARPFLA